MLGELDLAVYIKSHDDLDRTAERVFGTLGAQCSVGTDEETGDRYYQASGLGFTAMLYENAGDRADPWFESYRFALEIASQFWCVDLDTLDLEGPLSEYYGRQLAFGLDLETATSILVETTEEGEWFEIIAYRRNPQFRLDQPPTTSKVIEIERRREFTSFDEEEVEDEWEEEYEDIDAGVEE